MESTQGMHVCVVSMSAPCVSGQASMEGSQKVGHASRYKHTNKKKQTSTVQKTINAQHATLAHANQLGMKHRLAQWRPSRLILWGSEFRPLLVTTRKCSANTSKIAGILEMPASLRA
eukprot:GDKI01043383.1.p1 GENE.GDKI01043383.1~~GDKI01043383.1.p1  ORF type:complete len:134 (-),score=13.92 GDKI01043383.1:54-404(-)